MGSLATDIAMDTVTLLHFNDVYNIVARKQEPVGGASRFKTAINQRKDLNPMVFFSGDAFNPSLMSTVTKGKHMVHVLNALGLTCAVYGNHDFDFGVDVLVEWKNLSNFPWLISNVTDHLTDAPLAEGLTTHCIEWQGRRFGIIGVIEQEWISTLSTIDEDDVTYTDFVQVARELATQLKAQGCDYVIALTHMRWPNDTRLAEMVDEIDIILGGHDHDYTVKQINGTWVIKSGTDFRNLSQITLQFSGDSVNVTVEKVDITSDLEPDPEMQSIVDEYRGIMGAEMDKVIGHLESNLEGRFARIRSEETNLGNFITDIMLQCTDADVALLNSGTFRSDQVHPCGHFRIRDLLSILPMIDSLVVLQLTGEQIIEALENSVSKYPALEGRFPQVAGISFAFSPENPAGHRVDKLLAKIQGEYIDLQKLYRLTTVSYISQGKEGYDVFKKGKIMVDEEDGPCLNAIVQNHFIAVNDLKVTEVVANKWLEKIDKPNTRHRQSLIPITRRKSLARTLLIDADTSKRLSAIHTGAIQQTHTDVVECAPRSPAMQRVRGSLLRRASIQEVECKVLNRKLAPGVEGIIIVIDEQKRAEMLKQRLAGDIPHSPIEDIEET